MLCNYSNSNGTYSGHIFMVVSAFPSSKSIHHLIDEYGIEAVYQMINELPDHEAEPLYYDWDFWARDAQVMPAWAWRIWLLKGGRGVGKTRVGAETTRRKSDTIERIHLVGRTAADVRDVMIEGDSGLLAISPPWNRPVYRPGKRLIEWPNGSRALCFSADEPNLLRGPQCGFAWADEIAAWRYLDETWSNLMLGLRLGENPQCVATSTPRPVKVIKDLVAKDQRTVHITTESTYANRGNLAEAWFVDVVSTYAGTRLGEQEIEGKVLDDNPNALWSTKTLDNTRVNSLPNGGLDKIVVAVDPSVAENESDIAKMELNNSECGIVVGGLKGKKTDLKSHGYLLDDASLKGSPLEWAEAAVSAYNKFGADEIVAETNNGGALVKALIQTVDPHIKVVMVHASRGKRTRAEPVATMYETGRIHHLGNFPILETQLTEWEPGMRSPDRLDANVWLFTHLMLGETIRQAQSL